MLSATALGGAIATAIMIGSAVAEFVHLPRSWSSTGHLSRRLLFLFIILGLTVAPAVYIFGFAEPTPADDEENLWSIPTIIGVVHFAISVLATALFAIVPSGRMFGDRVAGKARKYLASQTFTASYPSLGRNARLASLALWAGVFLCKFVESYFFLTLSFVSLLHFGRACASGS